MFTIKESTTFGKWRSSIKDDRLRAAVAGRIDRLARGLFGDAKSVDHGISELRIHYGAGYRIYFQQRGDEMILLLCGGDKSTQTRDIGRAQQISREWR